MRKKEGGHVGIHDSSVVQRYRRIVVLGSLRATLEPSLAENVTWANLRPHEWTVDVEPRTKPFLQRTATNLRGTLAHRDLSFLITLPEPPKLAGASIF